MSYFLVPVLVIFFFSGIILLLYANRSSKVMIVNETKGYKPKFKNSILFGLATAMIMFGIILFFEITDPAFKLSFLETAGYAIFFGILIFIYMLFEFFVMLPIKRYPYQKLKKEPKKEIHKE
jgi:hypothetical protein